jgi:Icc-related predicted phosphoesterase
MKIVLISDTHCRFSNIKIPKCDILISCGDYGFRGTPEEIKKFHEWLNEQNAKFIISVQGNHELWVEKNFVEAKIIAETACPRVFFIEEGLIDIENIKIYCSAITPFFCNWAYNRHRGEEIRKHWDKIPLDIDVLVTHGPIRGVLDYCHREHVGCSDLAKKIHELKNLKFHAFGHIHEGYGIHKENGITFINASICDERYLPINKPIVFNLKKSKVL